MTLAGDSILVTPGSGATVATHTVNAKEHQVVMIADEDGHLLGSKLIYAYMIPTQVHVAVANTVHWDMFNADAALLVRVLGIRHIPNVAVAATTSAQSWKLARTTAVGTGGTTQTAWLADLSQTALDADITCRSKPTGGATEGVILWNYVYDVLNTGTSAIMLAALGGIELVPEPLRSPPFGNGHGYLLRQNQGLRCVQITSSAQGNSMWLITFTVE
jgi:hypothetical protein